MTEGSTYGESMKQKLMYERQSGDAVRAMLEQNDTNSRVNERMARICTALDDVTSHWRGNYKNLFGNYTMILQRMYLNLGGYAREQAVRIAQMQSVTGPMVEEKKRGGIMGWFTGG